MRIPDDVAPESRAIMGAMLDIAPDQGTATVAEMRAQIAKEVPLTGGPLPVAKVEEVEVQSRGEPLRLRTYRPSVDDVDRVILWIHGGGWVLGDLAYGDADCRRLCRANDAIVVAVEYALAPEHPFPAGLEDCQAALAWTSEQFRDPAPSRKLIVGGDSSGANLTAALCMLVRDRGGPSIDHQLLVYPPTDSSCGSASYEEFAEGYILEADEMKGFWELYVDDPALLRDPLVSVLRAENLAGLPPATVVVAGCDLLRDETEAFADKLQEAGVPVSVLRYPGQIHGFWSYGAMTDLAEIANAEVGNVIAQALESTNELERG